MSLKATYKASAVKTIHGLEKLPSEAAYILLLERIINFVVICNEFEHVNFRLKLLLAILGWRLVPMSRIQAEHHFVCNFIEEGDIFSEFFIAVFDCIRQLNFDKLIELFSSLLAV